MAIVVWILLQPIYTILDDVQTPDSEWAYQFAGIRQAQELGLTGNGVKVCIIDTGVDLDHPDLEYLKGNILYKDFCAKYDNLLKTYQYNNTLVGQAILGPYSPGSMILRANEFDYRGNMFD